VNYLQLCQAVVREGAIIPGENKPSSVFDQRGRMKLVVDWVERANREIQAYRNDFSFRSVDVDIDAPAGTEVLASSDSGHSDIEAFKLDTFTIRDEEINRKIHHIPWERFSRVRGNLQHSTDRYPEYFSIDPSGDIHLYPESTKSVVLRAEARVRPQVLFSSNDVPWIPLAYHDVIFYRALMMFYVYDEAPEQLAPASELYQEWLNRLVSACTPDSSYHYTENDEPLVMIAQ